MQTRLLTILIVVVLFGVGCADDPASSPAPSPQTPTPISPTTAPEPTEEIEPTAEPEPTEESERTEEPEPIPTETVSGADTAEPVVTDSDEPIYLAIIWHQHQPVYYKDPATNSYVRPWVRVHATKDYVDMVDTLTQYPNVRATFNLTPSLLRQIEDFGQGATDDYWRLAEIPADDLNNEQQQFILDRFFDTNRRIVARFPRYQELLELRDGGGSYTVDDFRDLQILFNLAWVDPDWLAQPPLSELVAKERGFSEADKEILFAEHLRLINETIPIHREAQNNGQIEVTMTPFAHPILPLLVDSNSARIALPDIELPTRYIFGQDAQAHVALGVELYESWFGRPPIGMWPAEGSVSQQIISMVATNGIQWMATDEGVLANSLGFDSFTRDSDDLVQEADTLYRPYYVRGQRGGPVAVVFRDVVISDKVGFTYSGMDGDAAASDFVRRIHEIRASLADEEAEGPHLVSVILDGENAWEFYENDGKAFLHGLYSRLNEDPNIITVTPSEFLEIAPEQPRIDELWAGSWINHDFSTWIGEEEENQAWNLLLETREFVRKYENGTREPPSPEALEAALELMYIAEGSDWFWWYGSDQNSGNDESFDLQFRETMKEIYRTLGEEPPTVLDVPVIPLQAAASASAASGLLTPTIDGAIDDEEWQDGGIYTAEGGVMAAAQIPIESMTYGFDSANFYLNAQFGGDFPLGSGREQVELYMSVPGGGETNSFSGGNWIGFQANRRLSLTFVDSNLVEMALATANGDESWTTLDGELTRDPLGVLAYSTSDATILAGFRAKQLEIAIPLAQIGNADVGDRLTARLIYNDATNETPALLGQLPSSGPAVIAVPDLGNLTVVLDVADPEGDDHGPGAYTYPEDGVFASGNFDILNFQVGYDEETVIFRFDIRGPVENHWNSPNGMSGLTLDVYIDTDGDGLGGKALLPGRNLTLADGFAWDYAIHAEGWTAAVYEPGEAEVVRIAESSEFFILADPGQRRVTIRVPKSLVGDTPEDWQYAAMVMGQEGFPSGGVMRIRDIAPTAEQWRFGGAPVGATNHTRIIDLVWPEAGEQEAALSAFTPISTPQTDLAAVDFAQIGMISATP